MGLVRKDDSPSRKLVRSKAKEGIKHIKNTPQTLASRKTRMPRLTKFYSQRPGVILPVKVLTRAGKRKLEAHQTHANNPTHQGMRPTTPVDKYDDTSVLKSSQFSENDTPSQSLIIQRHTNIKIKPKQSITKR